MIIGITGTIGSGKSSVCSLIRDEGYLVLDADAINHELMKQDKPLYKEIVAAFGNSILDERKEIDRSKLREIVFSNEAKKHKLEELSHKEILKTLKERSVQPITFWEIPLLFEVGWNQYVDVSVLVHAYDDVLIERVMKRSGLSEDEVRTIIQKQMSSEEKIKLADYVVTNNGDMVELKSNVRELLEKIL